MRTAQVTGGAGFIGSHVAIRLLKRYSYKVRQEGPCATCWSARLAHAPLAAAATALPPPPPSPQVVVLDKLDYCASMHNLREAQDHPRFKFVRGDITGGLDLVQYVLREEGVDTVLHFAAQTHVDNSFGNSLAFTANNTCA